MSSSPLLHNGTEGAEEVPADKCKTCLRICGISCLGIFLIVFALVWAVQGFMYWFATNLQGCTPAALSNFNYDGDADANDDPIQNLVPRLSLLVERSPRWFGYAFYVFPANDAMSLSGGQVGTWWRTWGPLFWTYTYEDMSSKTTVYMRRNLFRIGSSHRIARCDGKPPFVTFTEGSNWFSNRFRALLGYNQAMSFKFYDGASEVAIAEESSGDVPSLTFRNLDNDLLGSSVLKDRYFHGNKHEWLVKIVNATPHLPYFVPSAATLLFAFHEMEVESNAPASALTAIRPSQLAQGRSQELFKLGEALQYSSAQSPGGTSQREEDVPGEQAGRKHTEIAIASQSLPVAGTSVPDKGGLSAVEKQMGRRVGPRVEEEHV